MPMKINLAVIGFAASLAFSLPVGASEGSAGQDVPLVATDDNDVSCRTIVLGRDRIPDRCVREADRDASDVVCTTVPIVGSRIRERVCQTEAERRRNLEADLEYIDNARQLTDMLGNQN